jgi:hypothetical protein
MVFGCPRLRLASEPKKRATTALPKKGLAAISTLLYSMSSRRRPWPLVLYMAASPQRASLALPPLLSSWRARGQAALVRELVALTVVPLRGHVLVPARWSMGISACAAAFSSSTSRALPLELPCTPPLPHPSSPCSLEPRAWLPWTGGSPPRGDRSRRMRGDPPTRQMLSAGSPCCHCR